MIKAAIFDLDGLLIDSEPLWQEAEIIIFQKVNIILTSQLCLQTKGLRVDEVVDYWYDKFPWANFAKKQVEEMIVAKVIELISLKGKSLSGVNNAIAFVKEKQVKIAIASSSSLPIIQAALEKLNLTDVFTEIYSAESEKLGKPYPGVYLTTAHNLGVNPQECLAIEDSLNGVLAAKAAQMKCVAIPEESQRDNPRFAIADKILSSLEELNSNVWHSLS